MGKSATTIHCNTRSQQRAIPPLVREMLQQFGEERYTPDGAIIHFFSKRSRRNMEREWGRQPVARLESYLDAYLVERDGKEITVGHRYKHILRK